MDTRVLRYFLTVTQTSNITEATEKLHITRPTPSRQSQKLEKDLGRELLNRTQKGRSGLTSAGIILTRKSENLFQIWDDISEEVKNNGPDISSKLKVGLVESQCSIIVEGALKQLQILYPKLQFELYSAYSDNLKNVLDMMQVNYAILFRPVENTKCFQKWLSIYEQWGFIVEKKHPRSRKKPISVSKLKDTNLVIPKRSVINQDLEAGLGIKMNLENIKGFVNLSSNISWLSETGEYATLGIDGVLSVRPNPSLVFVPLNIEKNSGHVLVWRKNSQTSAAM